MRHRVRAPFFETQCSNFHIQYLDIVWCDVADIYVVIICLFVINHFFCGVRWCGWLRRILEYRILNFVPPKICRHFEFCVCITAYGTQNFESDFKNF